MKFSLSVLATTLCVSVVQAGKTDCLDSMRYNLETVCRSECEKEEAIAFSVSYDENNDSCRCYKHVGILGAFTDREAKRSCYSMAPGEKTKLLDSGDCIVDKSYFPRTTFIMKRCEGEEKHEDCVDAKRYKVEKVCHHECLKYNSVAFAVSHAEDDDICRCYPEGTYTGSGDRELELTCYAMDEPKIKVLGYGDCVPDKMDDPYYTEHMMERCPQVDKLLRGSVSV